MYREPIDSTAIRSVGYDSESKILELEFQSGGVYRYRDVPSEVYVELATSSSPGKFFHEEIRGAYDWKSAGEVGWGDKHTISKSERETVEVVVKPSETRMGRVVEEVGEELEIQRGEGVRMPKVEVIIRDGDEEFAKKLYKKLEKKGIVVGGIEVPGISWGVIIGGLLLILFLISIPFVGLIGAVGFTVFFGFLAFYSWITVESGVGHALDAKSLAQGKMGRDDRIVWRNLYEICDKYHQGKTARQIAI